MLFRSGAGNDNINLSATTGNIIVSTGAGNDNIVAGIGNSTIDGGAGTDKVSIDLSSSTSRTDLRSYIRETSNVLGANSGLNSYYGGTDTKEIWVNNVEQAIILTGSGNDNINASAIGSSVINTGAGNDTITVGTGNNTIDGGEGTDALSISGSTDTSDISITYNNALNGTTIVGGSSNQTTIKNIEQVNIATGSGNDSIDLSATTVGSSISAGAGTNTIVGGAGNDTITVGTGNNTIDGGAGTDTLSILGATDTSDISITYNNALNVTTILGGSSNQTTIKNIEKVNVATGSGNDLINLAATTLGSSISGGAGNNTIVGGTGNDSITIDRASTYTDGNGDRKSVV